MSMSLLSAVPHATFRRRLSRWLAVHGYWLRRLGLLVAWLVLVVAVLCELYLIWFSWRFGSPLSLNGHGEVLLDVVFVPVCYVAGVVVCGRWMVRAARDV